MTVGMLTLLPFEQQPTIRAAVLDTQPEELSEEHRNKGEKHLCVVKEEYVSEQVMWVKKPH